MLERRRLLARHHGELERMRAQHASRGAGDVTRAATPWDMPAVDGLGDVELVAMQAVVAALHRIDDGSYGVCASCGESIDDTRLEAVPTATSCIACEELRPTRRLRKIRDR